MMVDKIAFFDFDGTFVDFDTVNPFIRFVLRAHPEKDIAPDLTLPHKQYRLKLLTGLSARELDDLARKFYYEKVRPFLIPEMMERLANLRQEGYDAVLISGSYDLYLRYFCKEMDIETLICTEVGFSADGEEVMSLLELDEQGVSYDGFICEGLFRSLDCLGDNKLSRMREKLGESDYRGRDSIAFSDAQSDLPLLRSCRRAVVVSPLHLGKSQWAERYGFETVSYNYPLRRRLHRKFCYYARKIAGTSD